MPCVIPPCTLKSDESEPGLEPRCPLHAFSHKQRLRAELESSNLKFLGVLLQDSFAASWPRAGTWLCEYLPLLPLCCAVPLWNSVGRQQELPGAPADPMAECLGRGMLSVFGTRTSMALVEAAPQCPDCPCPHGLQGAEVPLPLDTQALVWEAGSRHSSDASAEYASILSHIYLTGKTVKTNV